MFIAVGKYNWLLEYGATQPTHYEMGTTSPATGTMIRRSAWWPDIIGPQWLGYSSTNDELHL